MSTLYYSITYITYWFIIITDNIHHDSTILVIIISTETISKQHTNQLPCTTFKCKIICNKIQLFFRCRVILLLSAQCRQMLELSFTSLQCDVLQVTDMSEALHTSSNKNDIHQNPNAPLSLTQMYR